MERKNNIERQSGRMIMNIALNYSTLLDNIILSRHSEKVIAIYISTGENIACIKGIL